MLSSDLEEHFKELVKPSKVWTRKEVLSKDRPVPEFPGIYAWYFKNFIEEKYVKDCISFEGLKLMYVGISPKAPPSNKPPSNQTLRDRIRNHMSGNAKSSTLRLTLGCLLSEIIDVQLRRVSDANRMTFSRGEEKLNQWLEGNAFVVWKVVDAPWEHEKILIKELSPPLNLHGGENNSFHGILTEKRKIAKKIARELEVLRD